MCIRDRLDTEPYQIDTTTVFDPDTYEKTVKYEKYVIDTITVFDADTYEETVKFERRLIEEGQIIEEQSAHEIENCYFMLWNNKGMSSKRKWTTSLIKEFLQGEITIASVYDDSCDHVESWSAKVIVVPIKKDPQVQLISTTDDKISDKLFNDGYLVPGTKVFFENVKVNDIVQKQLNAVITIIE